MTIIIEYIVWFLSEDQIEQMNCCPVFCHSEERAEPVFNVLGLRACMILRNRPQCVAVEICQSFGWMDGIFYIFKPNHKYNINTCDLLLWNIFIWFAAPLEKKLKTPSNLCKLVVLKYLPIFMFLLQLFFHVVRNWCRFSFVRNPTRYLLSQWLPGPFWSPCITLHISQVSHK